MKNIINDIKEKNFKRVYLLCGEEEYLKKYYKEQLVKNITQDDSMNFVKFEGAGIDEQEVITEAEAMPFFADYRLILLEDTKMCKNTSDALPEYIEKIPETTVIIFVESQVDKRNKLFKAISKYGYVCEINKQNEAALSKWVLQNISKEGKKITQSTMDLFLSKTGSDMATISSELEKLLCYTMGKDVIDSEDVEEICTPQITGKIFDMIDAISANNQKKTLDLYYDLIAAKEPPMRILFMLTRQFNLLILAKELADKGYNADRAAKDMGVQRFIAQKCLRQSGNFQMKTLKNALSSCVSTEEQIKSGNLEDKIGVEMLLIKYSS